jgi:hypothetical protein
MTRREQHGAYTAIEGKLAIDDARAAYVTGPTKDGRCAPIASFWRYEEAVAYAKESARRDCDLDLHPAPENES